MAAQHSDMIDHTHDIEMAAIRIHMALCSLPPCLEVSAYAEHLADRVERRAATLSPQTSHP